MWELTSHQLYCCFLAALMIGGYTIIWYKGKKEDDKKR